MMKILYIYMALGLTLFSGCQSYTQKLASHTLSGHTGSGITITSAYSETPIDELQIAQIPDSVSNQLINSLIQQGKIVTSSPVIISAEPHADINTFAELQGARISYRGEVLRLPAGRYTLRLVLQKTSGEESTDVDIVGDQELNTTVCISVSRINSEPNKRQRYYFVFLQTGD